MNLFFEVHRGSFGAAKWGDAERARRKSQCNSSFGPINFGLAAGTDGMERKARLNYLRCGGEHL